VHSLVTVDSGISTEDPVSYIATDNVKGGEAAATRREAYVRKGTAATLSSQRQVSSDDRQTLRKRHEKASRHQLLDPLEAGDAAKGKQRRDQYAYRPPGHHRKSLPPTSRTASVQPSCSTRRKLAGKVKTVAFDASDKEVEPSNPAPSKR